MAYKKTCDHKNFILTCWQCQDHKVRELNQEVFDLRAAISSNSIRDLELLNKLRDCEALPAVAQRVFDIPWAPESSLEVAAILRKIIETRKG